MAANTTGEPDDPDDRSDLEPATSRLIREIKQVNPSSVANFEWQLGQLVVNDIGLFQSQLLRVPKEYRRAAALLVIREVRRVLVEVGQACESFHPPAE